ncbi:hypothetical protein BU24DRAFT_420135 [Aaosphaeria arxii CBS 175.79]|uniref:Secreted protein n=1 Tax=Aaosphaeria arxii CBS 175.79 TaxID=1450172 RepID=A0A6A5XW12_9PLEO|nr:uncharacterized protein BU24DRAFT_420135 [Aaosphaeria arxii CBS 175.79]KAF2017113.1 hypothetical protein BU24DRAFT_420135 [Aaosphaeria arxii CBS 175.79]
MLALTTLEFAIVQLLSCNHGPVATHCCLLDFISLLMLHELTPTASFSARARVGLIRLQPETTAKDAHTNEMRGVHSQLPDPVRLPPTM